MATPLSITQRIWLGFGLTAVVMAAALALSLPFAARLQTAAQESAAAAQRIRAVGETRLAWSSLVQLVDNLLLSRAPAPAGDLRLRREAFTGSVSELRRLYPGQLELGGLAEGLEGLTGRLAAEADAGRWENALRLRQAGLADLNGQITARLNQLAQAEVDRLAAAEQTLAAARRSQPMAVAAGVILALLAALLSAVWINGSIARPLAELRAALLRLAQADFSPVRRSPGGDALARLSAAADELAAWLRSSYAGLEKRLAERTVLAEKKSNQLQAAAEIARDIASAKDLEELLDRAVTLVESRFGFYHAGIFLMDERSEYAVLQAATGEAGRKMLANRHRLRVGRTGMVGAAAATGLPRLAMEVSTDPAHFRNPVLPNTRSELALPLKSGSKVIGVLDVQSDQPQAFNKDDLTGLQILADQLTTAIENTRLLREAQQRVEEAQSFLRDYNRRLWTASPAAETLPGYIYENGRIAPAEGQAPPGEPLSVPIQLRDRVVAELQIWPENGAVPPDAQQFLEEISARLAQAIESARLFDEAQERATREETLNRLTAEISRSLDVDAVLKAAIREFGQLPNVSEASIRLAAQEKTNHAA